MDLHTKYKLKMFVGVFIFLLFLFLLLFFSIKCVHPNVHLEYKNIKNVHDKKYKILVYQTGAYKNFPKFAELSRKINSLYCNKWGYTYIDVQHPIDKIPPYWLKTHVLFTFLMKYDYDYIMYLDYDAIFNDFNTSIESFLNFIGNDYDFYIGKDVNPTRYINTGAYIVKNNDFTKKLISDWINMCFDENTNFDENIIMKGHCEKWKFTNEKWDCGGCEWAGISYEQGSLNTLVTDNLSNIAVLPMNFITNTDPDKKSFVLHLFKSNDQYREETFNIKLNQLL